LIVRSIDHSETIEKPITLKEDNVTSVQMMLQWIYTSQERLPRTSWCLDLEIVEIYLDFFKLADRLIFSGHPQAFLDNSELP
jgi:hypothetical protein